MMDPQAALYELMEALRDGDREAAIDRAAGLTRWISLGGFLPVVARLNTKAGGTVFAVDRKYDFQVEDAECSPFSGAD